MLKRKKKKLRKNPRRKNQPRQRSDQSHYSRAIKIEANNYYAQQGLYSLRSRDHLHIFHLNYYTNAYS